MCVPSRFSDAGMVCTVAVDSRRRLPWKRVGEQVAAKSRHYLYGFFKSNF